MKLMMQSVRKELRAITAICIDGKRNYDRSSWRAACEDLGKKRFGDGKNTIDVQRHGLQQLESMVKLICL